MIRPVTVVSFLMFCGAGLYLYQSKHEAQVLDRTIEHTVRDTAALREQTRLLATEWTMLINPERLRQLSDMYLSLKPIDPKQFTSLADLDSRLPGPEAPAPASNDQESVPVAEAPEAAPAAHEVVPVVATAEPVQHAPIEAALAEPAIQAPPRPPRPAMTQPPVAPSAVVAAVRPMDRQAERKSAPHVSVAETQPFRAPSSSGNRAESRPARMAESHVPEFRPTQTRPSETRPTETRAASASRPPLQAAPRFAASTPYMPAAPARPRSTSVASATVPAASPFAGSLLGMAHAAPAAPRPMPVNASYNAN